MSDESDVLKSIRQNREAMEKIAQRETWLGAASRYFLAVEEGEMPARRDCEISGLPDPRND